MMTPCPGTDQSVEYMTLKRHTWKADEYSIRIFPLNLQMGGPSRALYEPCQRLSPTRNILASLSSAPRSPSFASVTCFLSLFLQPLTSSTSVTLHINFCLCVSLDSKFFLSQNSSTKVAELRSSLAPVV